MEKNELTLEMLKASFNKIPRSNRTVGLWNLRREEMKKSVSTTPNFRIGCEWIH